jgi:glycosyltransferase involved in cell wall biosynthesis
MVKRILWISDLSETGYTNASRILVNHLIEQYQKYEIIYFAINHFHNYDRILEIFREYFPKLKQDNFYTIDNDNFEIKNINPVLFKEDQNIRNIHMEQRFGYYDLERVLIKSKPDIVISINDNGALEKHCKIVDIVNRKYGLEIKKICYLPIDCYNLPDKFFDRIKCDEMWALTKFGMNEMVKANYRTPIKILPHGMDTKSFYRLENKKEVLRLKWIPENLREKFLILNTNKNQIRKRLDITLKVFKEISERYPNRVGLVLKTGLRPSLNDGGLEIEEEIKKLGEGLKKNIFIIDKSLSIKELNELYNLVDCNINTSIGEGWGIIPCEVALCGIPQLVPDNTSYPEIFFKDCLVEADYKLRLEREGKPIINPKGLQCLCKGYRRAYEEEKEINYITTMVPKAIDSIILSRSGNDFSPEANGEIGNGIRLKYVFRTWEALEKMLVERGPLLFQVFVENGENLENLAYYCKQVDYSRLKKIYNIDSFIIDEITTLGVLIKEPKVSSFVEKISNLIENPEKVRILGELCRKVIYDNYRPDIVGKKLEELLDNFINNYFKENSSNENFEETTKDLLNEISNNSEIIIEDKIESKIRDLEGRIEELEIIVKGKTRVKIEEEKDKLWFSY